jgi:hypothetical protein
MTDKDAIRAAAVGQDFGADTAEFDPTEGVAEDVAQEKRGVLMNERESWERVAEGLKLAADGARQIARRRSPDAWNRLAQYFDSLRKAIVREAGGYDDARDRRQSVEQWGGEGMPFPAAHSRLMDGLRQAATGAEQIANCQRLDLRWLRYASQLRELRDKAHKMALAGSPLKVASEWRQ